MATDFRAIVPDPFAARRRPEARRNVSQANETDADPNQPWRPTRGQRLVAAGFLGAFGLTILTVLLTGLKVGAPRGPRTAPAATAVPQGSAPAAPTAPVAAPRVEPPAAEAGADENKTDHTATDPREAPAQAKKNSEAGELPASRAR